MPDSKRTPASSESPSKSSATPRTPAARIGRTIALTVVWTGIVYIVVVGFLSIIPQVFSPEQEEIAYESCAEGVRVLRRELLGRMAEELAGSAPTSDLRPFLDDWDRRRHAVRDQCVDTGAIDALSRLRYRAETHVRRYAREQGPLLDQIDRELRAIE